MSRYDWPAGSKRERRDDPAGRARFVAPRRADFDPDGALRASRGLNRPERRRAGGGGPFAPQSGREHLWQPLGPMSLINGQAEGNPRVSGRVNAIAVHEDGQRIYAASANGGVWYSNDGGDNWRSIAGLASTDTTGILRPAQRNACGAIHVVFGGTEATDVVYVGTGEVTDGFTGHAPNSEGGIGILRADGPATSPLDDPWIREAPNLVNDGIYAFASGGGVVIAATRTGLYQRPAAAGVDVEWERPDSAPFDSLEAKCTDILFTPSEGSRPSRHWVWVEDGDEAGLWVRNGGSGDFEKVAVTAGENKGYNRKRAVLAASTPATQVWVHNDRGHVLTPALFRVTNPDTGAGAPFAHFVVGVPDIVHKSGHYNIAIAVDPANPDRVALGGSWFGDPREDAQILLVTTPDGIKRQYDAAIVVADVASDGGVLTYGHPDPFTMIGMGAHPDVHALAFSNGGASLWTGCDGGVFRSDNPASIAGFYARNNGMSISESNYIATHPTCEGFIVAGLQDNGVVTRRSNGVWEVSIKGDGGGIVFDAADPKRWIAQYVHGDWNVSDGSGVGPLKRQIDPDPALEVETEENDRAAFYSQAASIIYPRPAGAGVVLVSQTLIGTDRLWYSDDFGTSWVTLPTGTDPHPASPTQDRFGQAITVCRWQNPDVAWVLGDGLLKRYARTPGSSNAGGPGTWTNPTEIIIRKNEKNKKDATSADGPIRDAAVWTDIAVNLDLPATTFGPPQQHGTKGAIYMGTVGNEDDEDVDTLWWFDGTANWFPTGLRGDPNGVPAPVTAIVCDPENPDHVWVGTTVGVWFGVRTLIADEDPTWTWESRLNGLPEAAVEDLQLFRDGSLAILRAAIAARGVWELRLDVSDVQDLTYLRAHSDDLRHRSRASGLGRDMAMPRSTHGSPDVRPRVAPAMPPLPINFPWASNSLPHPEQLRRFQAAMRASTIDKRIIADGYWDGFFSEVLRDHGAPTVTQPAAAPLPAYEQVNIDEDFWNFHMGMFGTADPWSTVEPSETDLYELTAQLVEGEFDETSCNMPDAALKIDVVVQFRGLGTLDGANVRVTLLRWIDVRSPIEAVFNDSRTWFTDAVEWAPAVNEVLNSEGADAGKTSLPVGDGWSFVHGTATQSHRLTLDGQTLDPLHPGIATFDYDASVHTIGRVVLFVAVIRTGTTSADDITLTNAELRELVLDNSNVAVRSVLIST